MTTCNRPWAPARLAAAAAACPHSVSQQRRIPHLEKKPVCSPMSHDSHESPRVYSLAAPTKSEGRSVLTYGRLAASRNLLRRRVLAAPRKSSYFAASLLQHGSNAVAQHCTPTLPISLSPGHRNLHKVADGGGALKFKVHQRS